MPHDTHGPDACAHGDASRPPCPGRRAALGRALALGGVALVAEHALLGEAAEAAGGKWYAAGAVSKFKLNKPVLVRFLNGQFSCFITKVKTNAYVCYSAVCTHEGCELSWSAAHPTYFFCGCHDGRFSRTTGVPTGGPPKRSLPKLPLRVVQSRLEVDLSKTGLV